MKRSVLYEMYALARQELLDYRRNRAKLAARTLRGEERARVAAWVAAIEGARALLLAEMPEKERAMTRLFGLDAPIPRYQQVRARMIRLRMELHVSEATLYKWQEDILRLVLGAAIEAGVIRPFGLKK